MIRTWWPGELTRPALAVPLLVCTLVASRSNGHSHGVDQQVLTSMSKNGDPLGSATSNALTELGNGPVLAALVGAGYLTGRLTGNDRLARASSLSFEALLDTGIWVVALKQVTARTRPGHGGTGEFFDYRPPGDQQNGSFPSGHAMGAFTVATVLAGEFRDRRWVRWVLYGTAGLISVSRLTRHRHFPSDVVVGAILGNSMGRMVLARQRSESPGWSSRPRGGRLEPVLDPARQGYGLAYTRSW